MKEQGIPDADEKTWGQRAHLYGFLGLFVPFGNLLAPLVILWLRQRSAYVRRHALEALNAQINLTGHVLLATALAWALIGAVDLGLAHQSLFLDVLVVLDLLYLLAAVVVALLSMLRGARRAASGKHFRYPLTVRLLTDKEAAA